VEALSSVGIVRVDREGSLSAMIFACGRLWVRETRPRGLLGRRPSCWSCSHRKYEIALGIASIARQADAQSTSCARRSGASRVVQ
jgi:hypothetical protein